MRLEKKGAALQGNWAKVGSDIKDGARLKILDAGTIDDSGNFGPKKVFKIMTTSREEFNISFNQTSLNNLIDGFGEMTESWVGKVINAFVIKQRVGDGLKNVLYLAPEGWEMSEDGNFFDPYATKETNSNPAPTSSEDDMGIPF